MTTGQNGHHDLLDNFIFTYNDLLNLLQDLVQFRIHVSSSMIFTFL